MDPLVIFGLVLLALVLGFIAGVLVGRNNAKDVTAALNEISGDVSEVKGIVASLNAHAAAAPANTAAAVSAAIKPAP